MGCVMIGFAILELMLGFLLLSSENIIGIALGIFLIIGAISSFRIGIGASTNNERVDTIKNQLNNDYEKYKKGLIILKQYYDRGITDFNDIDDYEERRNVQNIFDFCSSYKRQQDEYEIARKEKENSDFQTGATIAAGVALGTALSANINESYRKSGIRTSIRIKENDLNRTMLERERHLKSGSSTAMYDARIEKLKLELQNLYSQNN